MASKHTITVINGSNYKQEPRNILTGQFQGNMEYSPQSGLVYVASGDNVSVIKAQNDTVLQPIEIRQGLVGSMLFYGTSSQEYVPDTKLYVAGEYSNVSVIKDSANTKKNTFTLGLGVSLG